MHKLPNPKLPEEKRPIMANRKLRDAIKPGTALPHNGSWQRIKQQLVASGQWFWMVQEAQWMEFEDTGVVVVTSERYKHEFTRRMTKKEVFEYVRNIAISQHNSESVVNQSVSPIVNTDVTKELEKK